MDFLPTVNTSLLVSSPEVCWRLGPTLLGKGDPGWTSMCIYTSLVIFLGENPRYRIVDQRVLHIFKSFGTHC